ncbi:hypothetical protein TNCV_1049121 [Trichonephila clavipes]|nr:hypothetical protein TNCV_1049121 [Trichonephila clavipes]
MPQLINRSDWRMVKSKSFGNHGRDVSILERSGESASQGNIRTFSVSRKVRTIPATCGRALSYRNVGFHRSRIKVEPRVVAHKKFNLHNSKYAVNENKR